MALYLFIYSTLIVMSFFSIRRMLVDDVFFVFIVFVIAIFVGARYEIGGDWSVYLEYYDIIKGFDLHNSASFLEPGFSFLSWLFSRFSDNVVYFNVFASFVLMFGVALFCINTGNKWFALSLFFPVVIVLTGMGYVRQSLAIGFSLIAIYSLLNNRVFLFVVLILLSMLFHKWSLFNFVLLLDPRVIFKKESFFKICVFLLLGLVAIVFNMEKINYYLLSSDAPVSRGAQIRMLMYVLPVISLMVFRSAFDFKERHYVDITLVLYALLLAVSFVFPTVSDRFFIYLTPLLIYLTVEVTLKINCKRNVKIYILFNQCVFIVYFLIWLLKSYYAINYWLPYESYLI